MKMAALATLQCIAVLTCPALAAEPQVIEAVRTGDMSGLRRLIAEKADILALGSRHRSALHEAAAQCNLEAAQLLVGAGMDRLIRDDAGRSPAMVAMACPQSTATTELIRVLLAPVTPAALNETAPWSLQDAAARGNVGLIHMLLKLGLDVNAVGAKGNRALELACRNGKADVVKALLDHGADVQLRTTAGTTVLHEAALGGNANIIELLLNRGADVNAVDAENGATPLHYAASFGRVEAVTTLVRHGAERELRNNKGVTPSQAAKASGQNDIARLLQIPARK